MNFVKQCKYIEAISSMNIPTLKKARRDLKNDFIDKDRETKLELIDIMIEGKETLLRGAERL